MGTIEAAVVLAGGAATRFPGKLAAPGLHGRPLLEAVVGAAARLARRILVAVRDSRALASIRGAYEVVYDDRGLVARGCRGPLAGIITAARLVEGRLLIVSGDAGYVPSGALSALVHVSQGYSVTMLYWCNGLVDPLLSVADASVAKRVERLCGILEPRPTLLARLAPTLLLYPVYRLAVDPSLLASVNTPLDLVSPKPRGTICPSEPLALRPPLADTEEIDADVLLREARWWLERGIYHLALHAALDAVRLGGGVEAERLIEEARRGLGVRLHPGSVKT